MRGCGKHERTADAEMTEQHLTEIAVDDLVLFLRIDDGNGDVFE